MSETTQKDREKDTAGKGPVSTRVEVIANRSVEEDIMEELHREGAARAYTKIPVVFGTGNSGPKQGTHVWPEENFMLVVYCGEEEAVLIENCVARVKERFPDEGIKVFSS